MDVIYTEAPGKTRIYPGITREHKLKATVRGPSSEWYYGFSNWSVFI